MDKVKLIIEIDNEVYNNLKNRGLTGMLTCKECECMNKSIYNGTPLTSATNGEIFETMFGYGDEETSTVWNFVEDDYKPLRKNMFSKTWWNAPYKEN